MTTIILLKYLQQRYMGRYKSKKIAEKKGYNFTYNQLRKWGLSLMNLIFGKPEYDIFIDDKNLEFKKLDCKFKRVFK